ncbi:immunity protein YezG family protein [Pseudalkalibacillus sp. R45]|uniref:immunity protein YezG family protein n=1 Tax=Pseudalkalibacillus sp. R45 TaxID=3457433 RepID=UPI003FCE59CE
METKEMEKLYQSIGSTVIELIPEQWEKVYIYGQVEEDNGQVFFYYLPIGESEYIYSLDIEDHFDIDDEYFNLKNYELLQQFQLLRKEFERNNQELWSGVTFIIDHNGNFKINYDYDDSERGAYENKVIWEYRYLNIRPEDEWEQKVINSYLKDKEN